MTLALNDRVQQTGTANTTVSFTLSGSVTGFQTFAVIGNGNTTYYGATDTSGNWEVGIGTYSTTGPTLTRTTILASSNSGSAVTFPGAVTVFVTYPAEKSVNLDSSGNVSALGTVSSGTWQGSTIGVGYGGTGVTASSGANSVVLRDAYGNVNFNSYTVGLTVVPVTGGTTTLTQSSTWYQVFTGAGTQTVVLPQANLLPVGFAYFVATNCTGGLTIKDNAGTTVDTTVTGNIGYFFLVDNSTSAGSWANYNLLPPTYDFGAAAANFGNAAISSAVWNGTAIGTAYGGTGLSGATPFTSGGAVYANSATTLTSGTLPVTAGGTGVASVTSGYIPYGAGTSALASSSSLQFNGTYLVVGGTTPLGGATNPITAFSSSANNYVQTYVYNALNDTNASADLIAYADNSTDAHGWVDVGFTSSSYASTDYTVTGANEAYVFGSAPSGAGATGNLVYATDSTGSANAHQWYVGGFAQNKNAWKMQLTSTGLQVAGNAVIGSGVANNTTIAGAATGLATTISATGSDTNVAAAIRSKGTGAIDLAAGSSGVNISNGGTVTAITVTASGTSYTSIPSCAVTAPTTAGGVQATATPVMFSGAATIAGGGTGYTVNDVLTVTGGTYTAQATYTVTAVSGGVITAVSRTTGAGYSVLPSNPVSVTGGTGTGATLNLTWTVGNPTITNAGSGYVEQPTVSFSGGGGSGAAAYATVGGISVIRSLGGALDFYTPNQQTAFRIQDYAGSAGTGYWTAFGGNATPILRSTGASSGAIQTSTGVPLQFGTNNGVEQFRISHTASAVNYVQVTGAATTASPTVSAQGSDANIVLRVASKGTQSIAFSTNYSGSGTGNTQVVFSHTANSVNYLNLTGSAAGSSPILSVLGNDTNIDLALTPKGTGVVKTSSTGIQLVGSSSGYVGLKGAAAAGSTTYTLPAADGSSGYALTTDGAGTLSWAAAGGNVTTKGLFENANTISANYSITSGNNAISAGPVTVNSGVSVTVPAGSVWTIV